MVPTKNRRSGGFFFKKLLCYFLVFNHIWLGCAQATNSVISDLDTQADEKAWNHLAKIRVQITPENFLNEKQGFRLQAWQTKLSKNVKELEDSDKGTMLESEQLVNLPLTYTGLKDTLPELCTQKGLHCPIGGLNLFIGWNGKVWVNGGEADSISLETPRSLVFTQPVKVKGLTLKASHCTIQSELDVEEELEIGLSDPLKGLSIQQERGILSVQNMTLHEGHLKIQYGGTLILKDKALLDLNDNNLLNKSLLEALGDASIKNAGLIDNTFHLFAPKGHLSLQAQELKNHGARIEAQHLSLDVQKLGNQSIYRKYGIDSPSVIMATENLVIEGEGTAVNQGTLQGKSVTIKNKTLTNHHLIQAEEDFKLAPQETFTNEKTGWVKIEGKGTVSGSGTIVNAGGRIDLEDPLAEEHQPLEGAGMTFQNLLFDHFTGTLMNKGSWMVSDKVTGVLTQFTNNGLWKAANSLLTLENFENLPGAALKGSGILGNGKWTITKAGINRHIMKGDDLEIVIQDKFRQTETGLLQGNKRLSFTGTGTADLIGQMISDQPILLDMAKLYTPDNLTSSPIKTGATLEQWTIQKPAKLKTEGIDLSSPKLILKNEGEITADSLKGQAKELINDLLIQVNEFFLKAERLWNNDTLRVDRKSEITLQELKNEGDLEFNGGVKAQVAKTDHTGTMSFGKDSVYTGQTFLKKGQINVAEGVALDMTMTQEMDIHKEMDVLGTINLMAPHLNTSPNSKIKAQRKLSMEAIDDKGGLHSLFLKGKTEGKEQFRIKASKLKNTGEMLSPQETLLHTPEGFTNEQKAHLRKLDLTLNYGKTLHNTSTGEMVLSSPVKLGQGGLFNNEGDAYIGRSDSSLIIPGKMIQDTSCEFMTNYPHWSSHMFQHMSNSGNLTLMGEPWRIRRTLYNAPKGILILGAEAQILYNGFGNDGKIVAPHGLDISSVNPKNPLLLKGEWQTEGLLTIHHPAIDVLGTVRALGGSHIKSNRMTLDDHSVWQDEGTSTLWDIRDEFRIKHTANMVMKDWHLKTGTQGYHYGNLEIKGNALIEGTNFYHRGKTKGKGNLRATMVKEFDQIGTLGLEGNIALDAPILFDYPSSQTWAEGELSLKTSYPLTGYWEGTKHFSWEGKTGQYVNMISSGTLVSPTQTTLMAPGSFNNRGVIQDNAKVSLWNINNEFRNDGQMVVNNWHLKTGKQGYHFGEMEIKGQALIEGDNFYHKGKTWGKGHLTALMNKEFDQIGKMNLGGNIKLHAPILFDYPHSKTRAGGELDLKTSYPLRGYWEGTHKFSWTEQYNSTYPVLRSSGTLFSPQETHIYAGHGMLNEGTADLHHLSLLISPGSALTNTGDMKLNQPVSLGYDFNIQNKGIFKAGNLSSPSSALSYMVLNPQETFYGKNSLDWVHGKGAWHLVRNIHNQGELFLADSGQYWKVSGDLLNAPAKIWEVGGGLRLRSKAIPKNQGILKFLTDSEVEAHLPLAFTGEWQGLKSLTFWAPSLDNSIGKVRSKGILSLTSTQGDILVGQAQKVIRAVREISQEGYKQTKKMAYPPTFTGLGYMTEGECTVQHLASNDALFQSGTGIQAYAKRDLLNSFGLMHSQNFMTLKADRKIENYSGIIQAQGDILFDTPYLDNHLSDTLVDRISDYTTWERGNEGIGFKRRWQHPASDPALIASTGGNLLFKINGGRNHGSRILGAKSVLFEQNGRTSSSLSSFKATSAFMGKNRVIWYGGREGWHTNYTYWINHYPSLIQGGNTVQVVMPGITWSQEGMMNAPIIQLHLNNLVLDACLEKLGIGYHRAIKPEGNLSHTLIINLGEMLPQPVVKALKEGETLFESSSTISKDQIVRVRQPGSLSPQNDLPLYLSQDALQGALMQALSSITGTLNITKEFDLEAQMRALHRQAKDKSGKGQEIVLKDKDLKELKKSFIGYVAQKIGNIQALVAHLYLAPQDVNLRGLKPASLTGDKVMVEAEEFITMKGSIYGEHDVSLKAPRINIERPELRFKEWVEETTESGGFFGGSSKTTRRLVEYVLPGMGGDIETGKDGKIKITGDHLFFKGAQIKSGKGGLEVDAEKSLVASRGRRSSPVRAVLRLMPRNLLWISPSSVWIISLTISLRQECLAEATANQGLSEKKRFIPRNLPL